MQILADGRTRTLEDVVKLTNNPRYAAKGAKTPGFQVIVRGLVSRGLAECPEDSNVRLTSFCFPFGDGRSVDFDVGTIGSATNISNTRSIIADISTAMVKEEV